MEWDCFITLEPGMGKRCIIIITIIPVSKICGLLMERMLYNLLYPMKTEIVFKPNIIAAEAVMPE